MLVSGCCCGGEGCLQVMVAVFPTASFKSQIGSARGGGGGLQAEKARQRFFSLEGER